MNIVLDSSVLVAAYISRHGACAEVLEDILMRDHLVLSLPILDEVVRILRGKFDFDLADVAAVKASLERSAEWVQPAVLPPEVILGTAVAASASMLLTVDKDLLVLGRFRSTLIRKPGQYWSQRDFPSGVQEEGGQYRVNIGEGQRTRNTG